MRHSQRLVSTAFPLIVALAFVFPASVDAATVTMGETSVLGESDSGNGDLLVVQNATLTQDAHVLSLSFYVRNAAGNLRLGVYDATGPGGSPGNLVSETIAFTPVAGWNTQPVLTPVLLPAGSYWLAYFPSSSALSYAVDRSSGSFRASSLAFGSMPQTFPSSIDDQGTTHWSLYATLDTQPLALDSIPPSVVVDAPLDGALVSNIVNITADAEDNVAVAGVQFFIDGAAVGIEDTSAPYGFAWDTLSAGNGVHAITAQARDAAFNRTMSAAVSVNVSNAGYFQNEILATGLDLPTAIKFLPDSRMLVSELPGTIRVLPPPYTTPDPTPFLDLGLEIGGYAGLQQGIFDFAFDPDFESNHYYYVFYTNDSPNNDRLSRFTANPALDGTLPGSEVILYEDPQIANTEHHGGAVNFGNDGKLYFTTGEHFDAGLAQDLTSPRGKIHRINPDGTVPSDNPFYDGAGPNWDSIWAYGLRNPFRAYYDPPTDRLYVGDVGGNDYSTAYEEIDLGAPGANYGWPDCENGTCGNPNFTAAIHAYPHDGRDASITGGFVYHGTLFPAIYDGSYFFADYAQNWIRCITFNPDGSVANVINFEPPDGSVDGPYGDIVYLTEGPDGALYYVDLGYSDIGGTFGISKIRRIRYAPGNQQPTAIASSSPSGGLEPLTVNFSSTGSFDPEGASLTYAWDFGDNATSSEANPTHVYTAAGVYTARLTVSDGVWDTIAPPLSISVGNKPLANITSPTDQGLFTAGEVITYSGDASDTEDGVLPASAFTWDIDFLHAGHVHPGSHVTGVTSGMFTIPMSGHDFSGDTRYRVTLTVVDSDGLTDKQSVTIYPDKVDVTLDSIPQGLMVDLDGIPHPTPFVYDTLINFEHTIEASDQTSGTSLYTFSSWSDGGAQQHTITVPSFSTTYTASFGVATIPVTMGETSVLGDTDSGNGDLLVVQDATLTEDAYILSLSLHVLNAAGDLRLGAYDASGPGGGPGNLVAETGAFTPVAGWNTQPVLTSDLLPAGDYWLAYFPSSSSLSVAVDRSVGSYRASVLAFGSMPLTFPSTIDYQGTTHWSLYATLNAVPGATQAGRVAGLRLSHSSGGDLTLSWDPSCATGDSDYEVYQGDLGDFAQVNPVTCSTGGLTTATIAPAAGDSFYLVVPRNAAHEGSYGLLSDGSERPSSVSACAPQSIISECP